MSGPISYGKEKSPSFVVTEMHLPCWGSTWAWDTLRRSHWYWWALIWPSTGFRCIPCRPFSRIDPMHSRPAWFSSLDIILVAIRIWSSVTGEHDAINVNCTHILIIAIVLSFCERAADLPKMQLARSSARKANHNHSCGFSFVTASKHDQPYAHQFVLGSGTWSIASSSYKRWRKWNAKISSPPLNDALVQRACLSCRIEVYKVCERESFSDVEITQIPSIVDWTPSKLQEVLGLLRNAHVSIPATRYSLFWSSG